MSTSSQPQQACHPAIVRVVLRGCVAGCGHKPSQSGQLDVRSLKRFMHHSGKIHIDEPKPLIWTAIAESILTKVRRGRVALNQTVSQ